MAKPMLVEEAVPLLMFACLLSHEEPLCRQLAVSSLILLAVDWARYIERMKHLQTCSYCQARAQLSNFIAERTSEEAA